MKERKNKAGSRSDSDWCPAAMRRQGVVMSPRVCDALPIAVHVPIRSDPTIKADDSRARFRFLLITCIHLSMDNVSFFSLLRMLTVPSKREPPNIKVTRLRP